MIIMKLSINLYEELVYPFIFSHTTILFAFKFLDSFPLLLVLIVVITAFPAILY